MRVGTDRHPRPTVSQTCLQEPDAGGSGPFGGVPVSVRAAHPLPVWGGEEGGGGFLDDAAGVGSRQDGTAGFQALDALGTLWCYEHRCAKGPVLLTPAAVHQGGRCLAG